MFVDVIYILVTQSVFHGPASSITWELAKMQNVTPLLRPTELESAYLTSPHVMCMHFEAEEHCSRWDLLLGTRVSEQHGKIFFRHTKDKVWLNNRAEVHVTSTRTISAVKSVK